LSCISHKWNSIGCIGQRKTGRNWLLMKSDKHLRSMDFQTSTRLTAFGHGPIIDVYIQSCVHERLPTGIWIASYPAMTSILQNLEQATELVLTLKFSRMNKGGSGNKNNNCRQDSANSIQSAITEVKNRVTRKTTSTWIRSSHHNESCIIINRTL